MDVHSPKNGINSWLRCGGQASKPPILLWTLRCIAGSGPPSRSWSKSVLPGSPPLGDPPARHFAPPKNAEINRHQSFEAYQKKCQTELDGIWMNLAILPWNLGTLFRIGLMKTAILPLGSLKYIRVTTSQIPNNLHLFITVYLFTFNHHFLLTFADLYGHQLISSWGWYQQPQQPVAGVLLAETWPIQSRNGV